MHLIWKLPWAQVSSGENPGPLPRATGEPLPWHAERSTDIRELPSSSYANYPSRGLFGRSFRTLGQTYGSKGLPWQPCRRL